MYPILRRILIVTVLLVAYLAALVVYLVPYAWLVLAVLSIVKLCRRTHRYTAYGTARWADASDIPHLLEGKGLMVGHIEGKPSKIAGVQALFDSRLSAKAVCQKFLLGFQRKPPKFLVRLTTAIHTILVAPVGVGKSSGVAAPFLLTCDESAVVAISKASWPRLQRRPDAGWGIASSFLTPTRSSRRSRIRSTRSSSSTRIPRRPSMSVGTWRRRW